MEEREGPLNRIEFHKKTIEVGVEPVPARKDRGIGAVASGRKGDRELLALAGSGIDEQQGIAAPVIEKPDKHDVTAVAVNGGDGATVVADRCGNSVVKEPIAEIFGAGGQSPDGQHDHDECKCSDCAFHCRTSCVLCLASTLRPAR